MKDLDDKGIIRRQDTAIDLVRECMQVQIDHLSVISRETGRVIDYMELMKTVSDNVKNPDREAEAQAVLEKLRNIR